MMRRRDRGIVRTTAARTGAIAAMAAVITAIAALAVGAASASAQLATTQLQESYQAYDLFEGYKPATFNKCTKPEPIYISEPAAPGRYPVLVYLHGTLADLGGNHEGQQVAALAAAQGFVAAAFTYSDISPTEASVDGQANCMFNTGSPGNAISQVCALAEADCSQGFLVSGFSAGGAIAMRARNFNPWVQAAWAMGVSGPAVASALATPEGTRALPNNRLRIDVGQRDVQVTDPSTGQVTFNLTGLNALTGQDCTTADCLAPDGSGYYVVQNSEVADGVADHCYWMRVNKLVPTNSCTWSPTFDPGFVPPSTAPWGLLASLDWLRAQLGTSLPPAAPSIGAAPSAAPVAVTAPWAAAGGRRQRGAKHHHRARRHSHHHRRHHSKKRRHRSTHGRHRRG